MSVIFANDDSAIDHLVHEVARPLGVRHRPSTSEFSRIVPWANRRRNPRVSLNDRTATVLIEAEAVGGMDLSLHGVQFWTPRRVSPGAAVRIDIRWPDGPTSLALGRVVWATFERPNSQYAPHYRVGASFETWDIPGIREILERCGLGRIGEIEVISSRW